MKNKSTLCFLILIAVVGVFTLDVYLPGMQSMADQFNVTMKEITYTFTGFSIMFAITQLFHGAISDYIGRKPVVVLGLIVSAIATIICIYADNYKTLFAARILQAVGISSFVVVNAIIRDLYTGSKAIQIRSLVATASGISISIAPTIGGLLQDQFSWQGSFIVSLGLIVIILFFAIIVFQESNNNKMRSDCKISFLATSYLKIFNREYFCHALIAMLAYTVHFSFIILSSDIFINHLGATPLIFGYLMIVYGGMYFLSGLFSSWIAKKFTIPMLITLGTVLIGFGGLLMLVFMVTLALDFWQILISMAVITLGVTIVRSSAITGALAPIPSQAGQGAAGLNLIQFSLSAVIASLVSNFSVNFQISLSLLSISSAFAIGFIINRIKNENINYHTRII